MTFFINRYKDRKLMIAQLGLLLSIIIGLSSCYSSRDVNFLQDSKALPTYERAKPETYKLQINDVIVFRLITSDEKYTELINSTSSTRQSLKQGYRVYPDGTVDLPFLDSVKVVDKTLAQAAEIIRQGYAQQVSDAEIKIALEDDTYTMIGEAGNGMFPIYKENLTIFQALAQSGEINLSGDRRHVKIIRNYNGSPRVIEFDIRPNTILDSKYYYVYPNDIIYVRKTSSSFYKVATYGSLLGFITGSVNMFMTVFYFTQYNNGK